ncbi:MAG: hypothetical protein HC804_05060 [Anaerolineae bacterium]|nr:hypothetical protein [Anaerolineae bacterium]
MDDCVDGGHTAAGAAHCQRLAAFLRGPAPETAEWYWPYRVRPFSLWLKPLLAASLFWGVAAWWLRLKEVGDHSSSRATKTGLWLLAAASLLLQLALMNADSTSSPE